jgi:hypothetical protein
MTPANSLTQSRKPSLSRLLGVEHLEDRVVPGELLTGLLLLPMGPFCLQELIGEPGPASVDPPAIAVTETTNAGERNHASEAGQLSLLDRLGTDGQTRGVDTKRDEPRGSEHDLLFPGAAPAGDLGGLGWELLPAFTSRLAPKHLDGVTFDMSGAAGRADLIVPVPFSPAGTTSMPGQAESAVPGDGLSATESASAPAVASPLLQAQPAFSGSTPSGYSPAQVRHAYGFDQQSQDGRGITIAIVDAYDAPNILSDLNTFSTQFGLPTTSSGLFTFTKAYAQGSKPSANGGWAQETSLDVEWAHAIAPRANILLVEAANNSFTNLFGAVDYAVSHGASIVSMSWGASDFSGESTYDYHFNVPGVTFLAASGDTGGRVLYPSASPYVVSVGGTTLPLDASGNLTGAESAWSSGGGGASLNEAEPGYQISYGISLSGGRGTPDVAYNANPNTGFSVYDSYAYRGQKGWLVFGGTSAGAPQWAGLVALADQGRLAPLSSNNLASSPQYNAATGSTNYASNYRDITSGSNGYPTSTGYDLATGLGAPVAQNLVPYLAAP